MVNASKNKGTAAETAVVRWLQSLGFATAERLALAGSNDQGDVRLGPGLHLEVKAGNAAHNASRSQCESWLKEAEQEGRNAGVPCYLIVKRKGTTDPGQWRWFCRLSDVTANPHADVLIEMSALDAVEVLMNRGFTHIRDHQ